MDQKTITIQMFGNFRIRLGKHVISDGDKRSRRTWLTLAYLIYHRSRVVSQKELSDLLWTDGTEVNNPQGALRNILYQLRITLRALGEAGESLILRSGNGYKWNEEFAVEVDVEQFDRLLDRANTSTDREEQLACVLDALALYEGDFLSRMSSELWVRPITVYYHDLYLKTAIQALEGLREQQRCKEAAELGERVRLIDPYNEELYQILMKNCIDLGDCDEAASLYDKLSKLYQTDLGILPAEETRQLYYEAIKVVNNTAIPFETLQEQLDTPIAGRGAMVCDYDFFKYIYNSNARQLERNGVVAHIVLLTVTDKYGKELPARSRDLAMDHLENVICSGLRRTDVVSRCSVSQFVVLLPMANFENSGMVSCRLIKMFYRQYPHSPAQIEYTVHPLKTENADAPSR